MKAFIFTVLFLVIPRCALAMTEEEYRLKADSLKANQIQTDALLKQIGAIPTVRDPSQSKKESEQKAPLYQVFDSMNARHLGAGKLLFGRVYNRLVVGSDGSPVLIQLETDQGGSSGLRAMGIARQAATPGRLSIELNRLLLPGGKSILIQGVGLDSAGAFGLEAQVFSGKALAIAGAMTSSFVAGLAASQQSQTVNAFGFTQTQNTGRNAVLQGVAQTAADQSKRLIEEATAEKPILVVEVDTPVSILIQEEVRF